ncbi:MAG: presenilin family intramembrane aspartyl protease [Candidatus Parvarchaeota archaeon]|nr:presenilin family intramembrane aspartyl protease [Candidatus Parvarchaeota archaeon]
MKWERRTTIIVLAVFIASLIGSVVFSFWTVYFDGYSAQSLGKSAYVVQPYVELAYILISLFVVTAAMLFLIKRNMSKTIIGFFAFVSFFVLTEFFAIIMFAFGGDYIAPYVGLPAIIASALIVLYYFKYAGQFMRNLINVIIFITIASVLAIALGPIPSLILIGAIAVYDYVSVFITKHMLTLARGLLKDKGFLAGITFMSKAKKSARAMLGGGDIVFPAILIDSMFLWYSALEGTLMIIAAVLGLSLILFLGKRGKAYPAMAVIGPMQILFFAVYSLVTFI